MLAFLHIGTQASSSSKPKFVEAQVSSAHRPWSPFQSFQVSNVSLHFIHDFGIDRISANVVPANTEVQFNTTLTVGSLILNAEFTYDCRSKDWTSHSILGKPLTL
jgi:hypothetical protein